MMKKLTGRAPRTGNGMEPIEIWAHQPKMMMGMGKFNQAIRKDKTVDERIKNLVELKGAQMIGCEFCVDLGSQICRNSGFPDAAFGIGSAGFSDAMVCVLRDRPNAVPSLSRIVPPAKPGGTPIAS